MRKSYQYVNEKNREKKSFLLLKSSNVFFKFGKVEIELSVSTENLIFVDVSG